MTFLIGNAPSPPKAPGFDRLDLEQPVGWDSPNRNDDVAEVGELLNKVEYLKSGKNDGPTGVYDDRTDKALRSFQHDNGLKVDGLVNPEGQTIRRLGEKTGPDIPMMPPPGPGTTAAEIAAMGRAGPDGRLPKVRAPSPQRPTILEPGFRALTPPAAPHVGDRQAPPKPVVQPPSPGMGPKRLPHPPPSWNPGSTHPRRPRAPTSATGRPGCGLPRPGTRPF